MVTAIRSVFTASLALTGAAVVVFTMMAVESFDPRLIWDSASSIETEKEVQHV
jgi:uncharacterized paraquat-inducible protein A